MNKIIIDNNKDIVISSDGDYDVDIMYNSVNLNISVGDNVRAKIYFKSIKNSIKGEINYYLGIDSTLEINKFYFDNEDSLEEKIYLNGRGAMVKYNFSCIVYKKNYYKLKIFHNNSNVSSYINNKCIGNDGSEIIFDIDSILNKGNISCVMDQTSKVMCLGDVKAKICPNMYIDEEDVEARHGSVIGRFSDDDIFYIMSRCISYRVAIILLIKGFILSNLTLDDKRVKDIIDIIENNYK